MSELESLSIRLKAEAKRLGFDGCGIARAERLDAEAVRLEQWLSDNMHAGMGWMAGHFDLRVDPRRLVDGAKSVVSVIDNYFTGDPGRTDVDTGRVSRYAWGDDYHNIVKAKLRDLSDWLREEVGEFSGRAFVDSAPVMDKVWAQRAGLGWIGKHTNLINDRLGSYFFIGELIVDVELPPDVPATDHCGTCRRCIDACPTEAIVEPYLLDSNKCISYWTIEHRGDDVPREIAGDTGNWIFGCDICQEVCPWNKFRRKTAEPRYEPRPGVVDSTLAGWEAIDADEFRRLFKDSPVSRAKYDGFVRNVAIASRNARAK